MSLLSPYMGAPTDIQPSHGLLGAAQGYSYPMTSSLMGAISGAGGVGPFAQKAAGATPQQMSQTPTDYTALALQLAGNPHAGPYSTAGNLVHPGPTPNMTAGSTSGGSTGSQIIGGLLGTLGKNPELLKSGYNAIGGLLGDGLSAYGSGAAADAAVASTLAPTVASELGTTATGIEAANDAALASQLTSEGVAPIASTAAAPAASSAAGAGLGAAAGGALAVGGALLPLALAALIPTGENAQWWRGMTGQINSTDPDTSTQGKLTLANDLLNHPGDDPYSQAQLQAWGIPQIMKEISQPITTVAPGGRGWLGGGFTGASRA